MAKILVPFGAPNQGFDVLRNAGHEVIIPAPLTAFTREEQL